jgi:hypothetical protein
MTFYIINPYNLGWHQETGIFVGPMTLTWWRTKSTHDIYINADYTDGRPTAFIAPSHWQTWYHHPK